MTPEGKVKARVREIFAKFGAQALVTMPMGTSYGANGVSDFDIVFLGVPFKIETKATRRERPTVLQADYLRKAQLAGAVVAVIDADNMDDFEDIVDRFYETAKTRREYAEEGLRFRIKSHPTMKRWEKIKTPVIKGV